MTENDLIPLDFLVEDGKGRGGHVMTPLDILTMINHYKRKSFNSLLNESMLLAENDGRLIDSDDGSYTKFVGGTL